MQGPVASCWSNPLKANPVSQQGSQGPEPMMGSVGEAREAEEQQSN